MRGKKVYAPQTRSETDPEESALCKIDEGSPIKVWDDLLNT